MILIDHGSVDQAHTQDKRQHPITLNICGDYMLKVLKCSMNSIILEFSGLIRDRAWETSMSKSPMMDDVFRRQEGHQSWVDKFLECIQ